VGLRHDVDHDVGHDVDDVDDVVMNPTSWPWCGNVSCTFIISITTMHYHLWCRNFSLITDAIYDIYNGK
jgi:hypothetical protein